MGFSSKKNLGTVLEAQRTLLPLSPVVLTGKGGAQGLEHRDAVMLEAVVWSDAS